MSSMTEPIEPRTDEPMVLACRFRAGGFCELHGGVHTEPERPVEPATIDVAAGHVVHLCCGKLDGEPHRNFCEHYRPASPVNGEIVEAAVEALAAYRPQSREHVESMLLFWRRRAEMTPYDVEAVQERLFPIELFEPPACPAWCTGEHRSERDCREFRDCDSEEMFVPQLDNHVVCVHVTREFNRTTGAVGAPVVRLENREFTEQYARHLGHLLIRAADLLETRER